MASATCPHCHDTLPHQEPESNRAKNYGLKNHRNCDPKKGKFSTVDFFLLFFLNVCHSNRKTKQTKRQKDKLLHIRLSEHLRGRKSMRAQRWTRALEHCLRDGMSVTLLSSQRLWLPTAMRSDQPKLWHRWHWVLSRLHSLLKMIVAWGEGRPFSLEVWPLVSFPRSRG